MKAKSFISGLLISIVLSFGAHFTLSNFIAIQEYLDLSIITVAMMVTLSLFVYFLSNKALNSENKGFFINVILINVMLKLFLSFALVVAYAKITQPESKYFVVPFLFIYLIFTVFETVFLSKQSKEAK